MADDIPQKFPIEQKTNKKFCQSFPTTPIQMTFLLRAFLYCTSLSASHGKQWRNKRQKIREMAEQRRKEIWLWKYKINFKSKKFPITIKMFFTIRVFPQWRQSCSLIRKIQKVMPYMEGQQEADECPWPHCGRPTWKLPQMAFKLLKCPPFA